MNDGEAAPTAAIPVLSLHNVSVTFGGVRALKDVEFDVLPGEVQCIAGENGSGKSTLIKVITGVYNTAPGSAFFIDGRAVEAMSPMLARAAGIPGDLAGPRALQRDDALPRTLRSRRCWALRRASSIIEQCAAQRLPRSTGWVRASMSTPRSAISAMAQRQIVAIARALVRKARVIFMDEPTSSLAQHETRRLLDIVRMLSRSGIGVVFVSHRLAEVLEISSRVTVLRDGKLVGVYPTRGMTQSRLTELMTGKSFEQAISAR